MNGPDFYSPEHRRHARRNAFAFGLLELVLSCAVLLAVGAAVAGGCFQ